MRVPEYSPYAVAEHAVALVLALDRLIDTRALIVALKTEHLGSAGLDVYEEEEGVFFEDLSEHVIQDDVLARLLTFPNVVITAHQGFFTREALAAIATTTLESVTAFACGEPLVHEVRRR